MIGGVFLWKVEFNGVKGRFLIWRMCAGIPEAPHLSIDGVGFLCGFLSVGKKWAAPGRVP